MKIGFIGTGVMGKPMALNLAKAGYDVLVYNRTSSKAKALEPLVRAYDDLVSLVRESDIIFSIVGYPKDVKDIYEVIIPNAKKGTILVDMTTSFPKLAIELSKKAKEYSLDMLDAPVTGGDKGAINASLSIMVGGDFIAFNNVKPLLAIMGSTITYMGESGSGQYMKLANQASIAANIAGIAESLAFAKSKGLDLNSALSVINGGSASSWQSLNNGIKMINGDNKPGFYVKHFLKDLRLVLDEMDSLDLVVLKSVEKVYSILSSNGYDDYGTQSIIDFYLK